RYSGHLRLPASSSSMVISLVSALPRLLQRAPPSLPACRDRRAPRKQFMEKPARRPRRNDRYSASVPVPPAGSDPYTRRLSATGPHAIRVDVKLPTGLKKVDASPTHCLAFRPRSRCDAARPIELDLAARFLWVLFPRDSSSVRAQQ